MKNFLEKIEAWTASNIILKVLRNAMLPVLPLVIIGSVFQIVANLPTILPFIPQFSEKIFSIISIPYTIYNGIIGLVVAFSVGYYYSKEQNINQLYGGVMSVAVFLLSANNIVDGNVVQPEYLGSGGMFIAIVIAFLTVKVLGFCKEKNITIKLPDAVPPAVASSFDVIISGSIITLIVLIINVISIQLFGMPIPDIFLAVLAPLFVASNSVWFLAFALGFVQFCWFLGIHGFNMISGILFPLLVGNLVGNAEAFAAGTVGPNIGTFSFFLMAGHFLLVVPVVIIAVAKSEQLKAVGKLSLIPSIFNISEPYQFGLPIVGNVMLAIPNMIYLVVNVFIYYFATKIGFLNLTYNLPATIIPHPFFDYIATNGDFRTFILWIFVFVIDFIIWAPFMKIYDTHLLKEEQESQK